jgi:hypothetical protein
MSVRVIRLGRVLYPSQGQEWLFPADSVSGHLVEHKEDRKILDKWATSFGKRTEPWRKLRGSLISIYTCS